MEMRENSESIPEPKWNKNASPASKKENDQLEGSSHTPCIYCDRGRDGGHLSRGLVRWSKQSGGGSSSPGRHLATGTLSSSKWLMRRGGGPVGGREVVGLSEEGKGGSKRDRGGWTERVEETTG